MSPELDKQLCEKYPKIFADRYKDMSETAMCWGLDIGDGWYNIIDILCGNIQHHIDWSITRREMDEKWNKENPDSIRELEDIVPQVVASQVKEKFGTLRFYYSGGDDVIGGMVTMAEAMSSVMCEVCGNTAKQRKTGWIATLCEIHNNE